MITIDFRGQPRARAIIVNKSVCKIAGVVECMVCGATQLVRGQKVEEISGSIEWFIKQHACIPSIGESDSDEIINMVAKQFPECVVKTSKGNGHGLRRRE